MAPYFSTVGILAALAAIGAAAAQAPPVSNSKTSLTLLYQNPLNYTDDPNHVGAILLDPMTQAGAEEACAAYSESLITEATLKAHKSDFTKLLSYQAFAGYATVNQQYYISGAIVTATEGATSFSFKSTSGDKTKLPVLCTQSNQENQPSNSVATTANEITVKSTGNTFVGFRNQKSFRFLGIPYVDEPQRWAYSTLYSPKGQTITATAYGPVCAQPGQGVEQCHFLNIQTPYIPKAGSAANLRPVLFYIHGGGYNTGSGSDAGTDGGNLASREDIVTVTFNYRLNAMGFLAVPGTNVTGNYGTGDQVEALQWTINNIANFGGNPNQITIVGESAGGASVDVLLGSPPAIGKFQGAISQSNLGGGVTLGLKGDYATPYSSYYTIAQSYQASTKQLFIEAGCNQSTLNAQISCLRGIPAFALAQLPNTPQYVVQDGYYIDTEQLILNVVNGSAAHVPVMFGNSHDDGAAFDSYVQNPASEAAGIAGSLSISLAYANAIIKSGLFPLYSTGNFSLDVFNVSSRVSTDIQFRCIDQAKVYAGVTTGAFPSGYYFEFDRGINGYDPNHVVNLPVSAKYPEGDPEVPYFRVHSGDLNYIFGTLSNPRDANDLYFEQVVTSYWATFVKNGNPNPSIQYLQTRGYTRMIDNIEAAGTWPAVTPGIASGKKTGPINQMNYPSMITPFEDVPQCAFLNYSLSYYLTSDRG